MQKKLTITIDEEVYFGLYDVIGQGKISKFIENLVRPQVIGHQLESAYKEMSEDKNREAEAHEWAETAIMDVIHEKG